MQRTSECKWCRCVMSCPPPPWPACKASSRPSCPRRWAGGGSSCILPANDLQLCLNVLQQNFNIWTAYLFYIFRNWSTPPKCSPLWLPAHRDAGRGSSSRRRWSERRPVRYRKYAKTIWYLFFISEDVLCFVRHLMSEMSCSLGIKKCLMKYCQFVYWLPQYKILEKYYTFRHNFRQRPCL